MCSPLQKKKELHKCAYLISCDTYCGHLSIVMVAFMCYLWVNICTYNTQCWVCNNNYSSS